MKNKCYAVSVSGGKDSTAALLYMLNNYKNKGDIIPYFCDTGWEHPLTYEYLEYLEEILEIKIIRLQSISLKELMLKKKMFPNRINRFCTEEIKLKPSIEFLLKLQEEYKKVINVVGVRREESAARAGEQRWKTAIMKIGKMARRDYTKEKGLTTFQPVVSWNEREVYEYIMQHIKMNPLYFMGFTRVGCYPCVLANKGEIEKLDEDKIREIEELEKVIPGTFFYRNGRPTPIREVNGIGQFNPLGLDLGCINHLGICE